MDRNQIVPAYIKVFKEIRHLDKPSHNLDCHLAQVKLNESQSKQLWFDLNQVLQ